MHGRLFGSSTDKNFADGSEFKFVGHITMAHSLDLNVVAEGVEGEVQLVFFNVQGCDEVQGYLFSLPLEPQILMALLEKQILH